MSGLFITFEGPEGSGKTSVIEAVVNILNKKGIDVFVTREPGGSLIAEKIRNIVLDVDHVEMDGWTEALLIAAARRQHLVEKILPALKRNEIVFCDRYVDSSLAYQGHGRELGIDKVFELNRYAIEDLLPNLTIFIDVPPAIGLKRVFSNSRKVDRLDLENITFHETVYQGYQKIIQRFPDRIKVVDGTKPFQNVVNQVLTQLESLLPKA